MKRSGGALGITVPVGCFVSAPGSSCAVIKVLKSGDSKSSSDGVKSEVLRSLSPALVVVVVVFVEKRSSGVFQEHVPQTAPKH